MCFTDKKSSSKRDSVGPLTRRATGLSEAARTRVSGRPSTPRSPSIANTEQPKDDASIIRLFSLIDNSITDHVLNYYISPNTSTSDRFSQFGRNRKELGWVLRAASSNSTLKEGRAQVAVIRAIIGAEVFKAIRDGDFVPPIPVRQGVTTPAEHKLRLDYYRSLPKNYQYGPHREKAIDKLAHDIMKMTQPLILDKAKEETRLKSLKTIIENAAEFAVTIGKQKPSFIICFPQPQKTKSTGPRSTSRPKKKQENLDIPVLVPELRKYGDELGLNYDKYLTLVPTQKLPEDF